MKIQPKLVLASSSPFRKALLKKIYSSFDSASPDIDESSKPNESPMDLSKRLAFEKASALTEQFPNHLIIGSDQVAMLETAFNSPNPARMRIPLSSWLFRQARQLHSTPACAC